jgi:Glyoxalase/Bleomycin resistance protein/Dioxygenase superfamily
VRLYHVSLSVPQLEMGMEALARDLGVTWRPIIESRKTHTDEAGREKTVEHRLAYSVGGPPAIELMQRVPGEGPDEDSVTGMVIDHLGFWVDDLVAEWRRLLNSGWRPRVGDAAEPPKGATQLSNGRGLAIEIVDVTVDRPHVSDLYPHDSPYFRPTVPARRTGAASSGLTN